MQSSSPVFWPLKRFWVAMATQHINCKELIPSQGEPFRRPLQASEWGTEHRSPNWQQLLLSSCSSDLHSPAPSRDWALGSKHAAFCELLRCVERGSVSRRSPRSTRTCCVAISPAGAPHYSLLLAIPNTMLQMCMVLCKVRDGDSLSQAPVCLLFLKPLLPSNSVPHNDFFPTPCVFGEIINLSAAWLTKSSCNLPFLVKQQLP